MSATIPLPVPPARPHELFARAWVAPARAQAHASIRPLRAVLRAVGDAWAALQVAAARRATHRALLRLDDRTLRDIGIVRAEVESLAAEAHGGVAATRARVLNHATPTR